jgi:hypothetical protein
VSVPAANNLRHFAARPFAFKADAQAMEAAADLLDAIDALPDEGPFHLDVRNNGYSYAMRQVKALLHPEAGES